LACQGVDALAADDNTQLKVWPVWVAAFFMCGTCGLITHTWLSHSPSGDLLSVYFVISTGSLTMGALLAFISGSANRRFLGIRRAVKSWPPQWTILRDLFPVPEKGSFQEFACFWDIVMFVVSYAGVLVVVPIFVVLTAIGLVLHLLGSSL
jgi:hypothetical protein